MKTLSPFQGNHGRCDSGLLDKSYHVGRKSKKSLIYRLTRRTQEVTQSIKRYFPGIPSLIVDVGAADGLMLSSIKKSFPSSRCVGIELLWELLATNTDRDIPFLQGDVHHLPLSNNAADIVAATAVIEHLQNPRKFLQETMRILKPHGLMILTSPDPFWEKIATMLGHLHDEQHCNVMNLRELTTLFQKTGYKILEQKKFMLSPVGMPLELPIEHFLKNIGLNFLFANQLVVGVKRI
jgi:ubiquinone/menaquinone biosynthesis C-methylase UbiE